MKTSKITTLLPSLALGLFLTAPCAHAVEDGGRVWTAKRPSKQELSLTKLKKSRVMPFANTAIANRPMSAPVVATATETTVLSEDFSKFTSGSEEAPDLDTYITDTEGVIMYDYINTYGWSGINIYQAGGCCFLADGTYAVLMTPGIDLSADNGNFNVKLSFRAQSGSTKLYIVGQNAGSSTGFGGYISCTDTWTSVVVPFEGKGSTQTAIQFFGDAPIFIDDIEITQASETEVDPEPVTISVPVALAATDITESGFTANWQSVANATSYLLDVFYFEDNSPQYVVKDKQTTATSETVTGLEPGRLYYYSVQGTNGEITSDESAIIPVKAAAEAIGTPQATQATEISDNGFRANWTAVDNASHYELITLSEYTVPQSGTFVLEDENFDKVTSGTESAPLYNDIQCVLNTYTQYPDWYGYTTLLAEGMIGLKNYYSIMGSYSMLYTPAYQSDAANPGAIKAKISAKMVNCNAGTKLGVALVDATTGDIINNKWHFQDLSEQMTEYEFELGQSSNFYLAIGFSDPYDTYGTTGMVFIDDVQITQDITAGTNISRIYSDDIAYNNTMYVETPEKRDGENFYYYVLASTNSTEGYIYSDPSNIVQVGTSTAIGNVQTENGITITAAAGQINVTTDKACTLTVFDMSGRTVSQLNAVGGSASVSVEPGAYIVKCGNAVRKLIVR